MYIRTVYQTTTLHITCIGEWIKLYILYETLDKLCVCVCNLSFPVVYCKKCPEVCLRSDFCIHIHTILTRTDSFGD